MSQPTYYHFVAELEECLCDTEHNAVPRRRDAYLTNAVDDGTAVAEGIGLERNYSCTGCGRDNYVRVLGVERRSERSLWSPNWSWSSL